MRESKRPAPGKAVWIVRTDDGMTYRASEFDRDQGLVRFVGRLQHPNGRLGALTEYVVSARRLEYARREVAS